MSLHTRALKKAQAHYDSLSPRSMFRAQAKKALDFLKKQVEREEQQKNKYRSVVYLIEASDGYCIGMSTQPRLRVYQYQYQYQRHNPSAKLVATFPGYLDEERATHEQFDAYRIEGQSQWFTKAPEILAYFQQQQQQASEKKAA